MDNCEKCGKPATMTLSSGGISVTLCDKCFNNQNNNPAIERVIAPIVRRALKGVPVEPIDAMKAIKSGVADLFKLWIPGEESIQGTVPEDRVILIGETDTVIAMLKELQKGLKQVVDTAAELNGQRAISEARSRQATIPFEPREAATAEG